MSGQRITGTDSLTDAFIKLAEGNIGALTALMHLSKAAPVIDPESVWLELGPVISFDAEGIYGHRIWMLWKDACGQVPIRALTLLRASQLGIITTAKLNAIIDGEEFEFQPLLDAVRAYVPRFGLETV